VWEGWKVAISVGDRIQGYRYRRRGGGWLFDTYREVGLGCDVGRDCALDLSFYVEVHVSGYVDELVVVQRQDESILIDGLPCGLRSHPVTTCQE
jgi:hypothetical protein